LVYRGLDRFIFSLSPPGKQWLIKKKYPFEMKELRAVAEDNLEIAQAVYFFLILLRPHPTFLYDSCLLMQT